MTSFNSGISGKNNVDVENNWTKIIPIEPHLKTLKYGANKYLLFLSFMGPQHLIGVGLLSSIFLPTIVVILLSIIFVIYPLIRQLLRYYKFLPIPYAKEIIRMSYTARCDGDFVVCLIGIRPNGANPFTKAFIEAGNAFRRILAELEADPALGYMGGDIYVGTNDRKSTTLVVQYWRDYESLERWTHTKMGIHVQTMMGYLKNHRQDGEYGVWHETYKVNDGDYEAIYVNMPPIGLALATEAVQELKTCNASERLKRRSKD